MKTSNVIGVAALALLGAACVKLYGEYKYHCGKVDAGNFYIPIIETMTEQYKKLCEELKKKEEA